MKRIFFLLVSCILLSSLYSGEIEVRSLPDGYYDSKEAYVFSDAPFLLSFFSYVRKENKPFTAENVVFSITLPANFKIVHYGLTRVGLPASGIKSIPLPGGKKRWSLSYGRIHFKTRYSLSGSYSILPWADTFFLLFVKPVGKVPASFTADWQIEGNGLHPVRGEMKLKTLPAPVLKKVPSVSVHSSVGFWGENRKWKGAWTRETFLDMVKTLKKAGVTVLEETGGMWMPESLVSGKELRKMGFSLEYMGAFNYPQRVSKEKMNSEGFKVTEEDMMVDLLGRRVKSHKEQRGNAYIFCFSSMAEKNSPVRKYIRKRYESLMARGFNLFYDDTEPRAYAFCYCTKCRKRFAQEEKVSEKDAMTLSGLDLIAKYPVKWYVFQCRSFARIFSLLQKELGTNCKVGSDSTMGMGKFYLDDFKSAGMVNWAEDPRIADGFLAYHDADTLSGNVGSIFEAKHFFQRNKDGTPVLKKPVVVRAASFQYVHAWTPFSVLGRRDAAKRKKLKGLGLDARRVYNKLTVANVIALGASGVRVYQDYSHADAASLTGICEGLEFAGEMDEMYKFAYRDLQGEKKAMLYDCTGKVSPFEKNAADTLLGRYYYRYAKTFGMLQYTLHKKEGKLLLSLFNWDPCQKKNLRIKLPRTGGKVLFVNILCDKEKYSLPGAYTGKDLSIDLPAGGAAAILLSPERIYAVTEKALPVYTGGKEVKMYEIGAVNAGMEPFMERVYNYSLKLLQRIYPGTKMPYKEIKNKMDYWRF